MKNNEINIEDLGKITGGVSPELEALLQKYANDGEIDMNELQAIAARYLIEDGTSGGILRAIGDTLRSSTQKIR